LPLYPVLCQRTPSGSSIRGFVLYRVGALPRTTRAGHTQAQVPVQEQAAQPGLDHHLALLDDVPWAKFRRAKGGVKAHVLLDHDDYLPAYVLLTEAKRSDVKLADSFRLNPGSIVAIDRGYIDYALFARWSLAGVFFVTRLKDNAAFEVVEECEIPQNRNIRADQFIRLTGAKAQADLSDLLRRIVAWDAENSARSSC
jgi:Transposase DDE domain.